MTRNNLVSKSGGPPPKKVFKSAEFVEDSGDENAEPGRSSQARRPTVGGKKPCEKVRKEAEAKRLREEAAEQKRLAKEAIYTRYQEWQRQQRGE